MHDIRCEIHCASTTNTSFVRAAYPVVATRPRFDESSTLPGHAGHRNAMQARSISGFLFSCLLSLALASGVACGGSEPVEDDGYSEFDRELQRRLETDLSITELSNRFQRDRPEFEEYVALFKDERLGARMRADLIAKAADPADPFLRGNLSYLLAQAGFSELREDILRGLGEASEYLRYRSVLALPYIWKPNDLAMLARMIGTRERAGEVRTAAQSVMEVVLRADDLERVLELMVDSEDDLERAGFLGKMVMKLLGTMRVEQREERLATLQRQLGQESPAIDEFLLRELKGAFGPEQAGPLATILADAARDAEQRRAAHQELIRLAQAGANTRQAVLAQGGKIRTMLVGELATNYVSRVLQPKEVLALFDPIGLDAASTTALFDLVRGVEIADWRRSDERHVVALTILANHAPYRDELVARLIDGMPNPDLSPTAAPALLRFALERADDQAERQRLVSAAAIALSDARRDVATQVARGLAALGTPEAIDALLQGVAGDTPDVAEISATALLALIETPYLIETRFSTLWLLVHADRRAQVSEANMIHALRVLAEVGTEHEDIAWFESSCAIEATSGAVREGFRLAIERIRARAR
mgnify:CR=1 FL=1